MDTIVSSSQMESIGSQRQLRKRSEKISYVEDSAITKPKISAKKKTEPSEKLSANPLTPDAAASKRSNKSSSKVVAKRSAQPMDDSFEDDEVCVTKVCLPKKQKSKPDTSSNAFSGNDTNGPKISLKKTDATTTEPSSAAKPSAKHLKPNAAASSSLKVVAKLDARPMDESSDDDFLSVTPPKKQRKGKKNDATKTESSLAAKPSVKRLKPNAATSSSSKVAKLGARPMDESSDDDDDDFVSMSPPKKQRKGKKNDATKTESSLAPKPSVKRLKPNAATSSSSKVAKLDAQPKDESSDDDFVSKVSPPKKQSKAVDSKNSKSQSQKRKSTKAKKNDATCVGSSGSEDEWEEMDEALPAAVPVASSSKALERRSDGDIEITVDRPQTDNEKKWQTFLRREINRARKDQRDQAHKTHLLCYIAHLRHWSTTTNNELVKAVAMSLVPDGFVTAAQHTFGCAVAERFVKWFKSAVVVGSSESNINVDSVAFIMSCLANKSVDNLTSLTLVLLAILRSLGLDSRLCLSCQPISHKLPKDEDDDWETDEPKAESSNKGSDTTKKKSTNSETLTKAKKAATVKPIRNSWVEYWNEEDEQWIAIDPLHAVVDQPKQIEADVSKPMHYVLAVENDGGIRDLTSRYASSFLSVATRRLRTDPDWWSKTLKRFTSARNRQRIRLEDMLLHSMLMSQPLPTVVSEFKNHPLYMLKRDLLKFQGIYPPDIKPIGHIRNEDVYARTAVHTLHCKESWIKDARVIKEGEEPYKIVKARPKFSKSAEANEEQPERPLPLFGFWQTEPYVPQPAKDGKVPRNQYGNVELFKPSMLPPGTVHLRIPSLLAVARKLDIDCAPAMVGWEFHCRSSVPLMDGWIVCKEHVAVLLSAWKEEQARKEQANKEKKQQRALTNWKRMIKGLLTMQKMRRKFNPAQGSSKQKSEERLEDNDEDNNNEDNVPDDPRTAWPQCKEQFNIDANM